MTRWLPILLVLFSASGCGAEKARTGGDGGGGEGGGGGGLPTSTCPPGERELDDGSCLPAGTQPSGCAAGEWPDDEGTCVPAGIGPDQCGEGFAHDGDVGCDPVLPAADCAAGTWAIPGDTSCRDFADCGAGPYADGMPATGVVYVDAATSPPYDGTIVEPFKTIQDAVDAAADGDTIAMAAGTYDAPTIVEGKTLTLWGRCASMVSLVADGAPAVTFGAGSSGSEARGLGISGDGRAVVVNDAEGVVLHDLWLHDLTSDGVTVERLTAPSEATVRRSLVEQATGRATYAVGAQLTVEEVAVRDMLPNNFNMGRAVDTDLQPVTGERNDVTVRRIHVTRAQEVAVMVHASTATVIDSFISDTQPTAGGRFGRGINVQTDTADQLPVLTVSGSVIDGGYDGGIVATTGALAIDRTVVRRVEPNLDDGFRGYGIAMQALPIGDSVLDVTHSLVTSARETGIFSVGATTVLESVVVRDMQGLTDVVHPTLPDNFGGRGVSSQFEEGAGIPASMTLRGCVVDHAEEVGVGAFGSELLVEGTLITHTRPVVDRLGRGVVVQVHPTSGVRASATLRDSVVVDSVEVGVFMSGSSVAMDGVLIDGVVETATGINGVGISLNHDIYFNHPADAVVSSSVVRRVVTAGIGTAGSAATVEHSLIDEVAEAPDVGGTYGDGVVAFNYLGASPKVLLHDNRIVNVERGGVAVFGTVVDLSAMRIECADIDLPVSQLNGISPDVTDLGNNVCGCGDESKTCKILDAMLAVPSPPDSF